MFEVGKLYHSEYYCIFLYQNKESAAHVSFAGSIHADDAASWSKRFDRPVNYINKNVPILVLNVEDYIEVLAGDQKGWIIEEDWLQIKDIR